MASSGLNVSFKRGFVAIQLTASEAAEQHYSNQVEKIHDKFAESATSSSKSSILAQRSSVGP
jgi:hypothetical protein